VCGIYVDLNQIHAGEALTPEDSRYTSAYDRIQGRNALAARDQKDPGQGIVQRDRWLCDLTLDEGSDVDVSQDVCSKTPWRASDKGLLPVSLVAARKWPFSFFDSARQRLGPLKISSPRVEYRGSDAFTRFQSGIRLGSAYVERGWT